MGAIRKTMMRIPGRAQGTSSSRAHIMCGGTSPPPAWSPHPARGVVLRQERTRSTMDSTFHQANPPIVGGPSRMVPQIAMTVAGASGGKRRIRVQPADGLVFVRQLILAGRCAEAPMSIPMPLGSLRRIFFCRCPCTGVKITSRRWGADGRAPQWGNMALAFAALAGQPAPPGACGREGARHPARRSAAAGSTPPRR